MYRRNFTRMNPWEKIKRWVDKGYLKTPPLFSIFKVHNNDRFPAVIDNHVRNYEHLYRKLFDKYPDADSQFSHSGLEVENPISSLKSFSSVFVDKQIKYMQKGFTEEKSFRMVEDEFAEPLQKEKFERSLFEGLAVSNRSRSLMNYYEQEAEFETRQKLNQLQRMLPQYKRYHSNLEKVYEGLVKHEDKPADKQEKILNNYEPATCMLT
jgi:hypothetical protein